MQGEAFQRLRYMGLVSAISGWLVIIAAITRNPWFNFWVHAFSDLGGPMASDPWLFSYGMVLTGVFIVLYAFYLIHISYNKPTTIGAGFMIITGIFLMLIGFFPSGTKHHYFVSVWFFTQADLAILMWGIGLYRAKLGKLFLFLSLVGPVVAFIIPWPSTAAVEAYGLLIMNIWVLAMTRIRSGDNSEALYPAKSTD